MGTMRLNDVVTDTEAMQLHINEISRRVASNAHAVLLMDRAAWHTTGELRVPVNITPIFLPSRSPELNPQENIWQSDSANPIPAVRARALYDQLSSLMEQDGKVGTTRAAATLRAKY